MSISAKADRWGIHDPADRTPLLRVLGVVSRTRYHEPSARDARERISAFFHSKLDA
jgi:carboxymethylenebutenolidase